MKRPELGQRISASDRLVRRHSNDYHTKEWRRFAYGPLNPKPVEGIYIGWRTYTDGTMHIMGYDEGVAYRPTRSFEVWLIVPGPRLKPVPVLPDDVSY